MSAVRAVRSLLARTGVIRVLDHWAKRSRAGLWLRSLLAIYDLEDLRRLDVPWWTFRAAIDVDGFLAARPDARVFEWGSGASTFWLARRAAEVHSVEHDAAWAATMREDLPPNVDLQAVPPVAREHVTIGSAKRGFGGLDFADYVGAIDRVDGLFDVVVIDGRAREACLPLALDRLAPGGIVVYDNVERRRYRDSIASLAGRVTVTSAWGRTACLPYPTRTALIREDRAGA